MQIEGQGVGGQLNRAKVNSEGALKVRSVCATEVEHSVIEGDAFQAYTSVVTITGDTRTAIVYLQNNDQSDILITSVAVGTSPSTGGVNDEILIEAVGNVLPTDDIATNGTLIPILNRNGGASRVFDGIAKKGPSLPAVNGVATTGTLSSLTNAQTFMLTTVIPKGGALSVEVLPPAGNTEMDITISIAFHVQEEI